MKNKWTWIVTNSQERADKAIGQALALDEGNWEGVKAELSRSQIQKFIDAGNVKVNGREIKSNEKIACGLKLEMILPPPEALDLVPEDLPLDILFQDEHLLVLNKPAGLTVHPSTTQKKSTLVHALLHHIKDLSGIGGKLRPGIVHRLDKDTSGALVITKTDQAHRKLVETFSLHDIDRVYWALVYGSPGQEEQKIESLIGRSPKDRKKMSMEVKEGRHAISYVKVCERYGRETAKPFAAWMQVKLETGRTHQVRVHLTGVGHSLLGDPSYGTPSKTQPKWTALPKPVQEQVLLMPGQALHARVLGFSHPITGEKLRFEAEPPQAFKDLHDALKKFK